VRASWQDPLPGATQQAPMRWHPYADFGYVIPMTFKGCWDRAGAVAVVAKSVMLLAACVGLVATALAACGTPAATVAGRPEASSASTTMFPRYAITIRTLHGLGTILTDGEGYTLYLFLPDNQSGRSSCTGFCATAWPPLVLPSGIEAPLAGPGVKASLLRTTIRPDGSVQITYNGWPLYLWSQDTAPGQATGQGVTNLGGLWYVESPEGNPIR